MNINELTYGQLKEIMSMMSNQHEHDSIYECGKQYFIRTATYHCVGLLIKKTKNELELENASWIADSGRLNNALKTGEFNEIELFPENLIVNINGIIDATLYPHTLPEASK